MRANKSRSRKSVHFTHHLCREHGKGDERTTFALMLDDREYVRLFGGGRRPETGCCKYAMGTKEPHFTTDPRKVTCRACRAEIHNGTAEQWAQRAKNARSPDDRAYYSKWVSNDELTVRCWTVCCRRYDAPCPISKRELLERDRARRAAGIERAIRGVACLQVVSPDIPASSIAAELEENIAKLDPGDRTLAAAALSQAREVDRLLLRASEILAAIESIAVDAAKRVRSCALVSLPRGAS